MPQLAAAGITVPMRREIGEVSRELRQVAEELHEAADAEADPTIRLVVARVGPAVQRLDGWMAQAAPPDGSVAPGVPSRRERVASVIVGILGVLAAVGLVLGGRAYWQRQGAPAPASDPSDPQDVDVGG